MKTYLIVMLILHTMATINALKHSEKESVFVTITTTLICGSLLVWTAVMLHQM